MPSLKYIKNRIKGINSTKKITQAMKIVSASSLRSAQNSIVNSEAYLKGFQRLLIDVNNKAPDLLEQFISLSTKIDKSKTLFVAFGSDKGLCGSFNSKITGYITSKLQQNNDVKIFCVGNRISQYMQAHHKKNIEESVPFFRENNKKISYNASVLLSKEIKDVFIKEKFSECRVIYTKFNSVLSQQVKDIKLIPLQMDEIKNTDCFAKSDGEIFEFDNDIELILKKLIDDYIAATILHVCAHSLTCEHSTRMLAMDSATKNSDKMLKELNLLYNRSRQAIITKELIEIISGAEATN